MAYVLIVVSMLGGYVNGAPIMATDFADKASCEAALKWVRDTKRSADRYGDKAECFPKADH